MATVKLLKPARLHVHGLIFEKDVPREDVEYSIARKLEDDDRFKVKFTDEEVLASRRPAKAAVSAAGASGETDSGKPKSPKAISAAIREAIDNMDIDDEKIWTTDGKPDARHLTHLLGWQVTSAERDAAMPTKDETTSRGNITITRKQPLDTGEAAAAASEAASSASAETTEEVDTDGSTEGAVQV